MSYKKYFKPSLQAKFADDRWQVLKVMAKKNTDFTSPSIFFYNFENSPCAKNIQVQLEIDTIGKWRYVPVVYIGGISTALCARVFHAQVFLW